MQDKEKTAKSTVIDVRAYEAELLLLLNLKSLTVSYYLTEVLTFCLMQEWDHLFQKECLEPWKKCKSSNKQW